MPVLTLLLSMHIASALSLWCISFMVARDCYVNRQKRLPSGITLLRYGLLFTFGSGLALGVLHNSPLLGVCVRMGIYAAPPFLAYGWAAQRLRQHDTVSEQHEPR